MHHCRTGHPTPRTRHYPKWRHVMGDKGSKKNKEKDKKQKQEQSKKKDEQQKAKLPVKKP